MTDLIVVGSGAAGLTAALAAANRGLRVLVLEKALEPGGTTARSGGSIWIPGNPWMGEAEEPADALPYLARTSFPHRFVGAHPTLGLEADDFALLQAFCANCVPMVELLHHLGAVFPTPRPDPGGGVFPPYPDYQAHLPEHTGAVGRTITTGDPGQGAGADFIGGGGRALVSTLMRAAERLGVAFRFGQAVRDVVVLDGRVVGVTAEGAEGSNAYHAEGGVIFATGGFLMNHDLRRYLPAGVFGGSCAPTNTGDFVPIAARLGARFGNMCQAWWDQVAVEDALQSLPTTTDIWYVHGDSAIQVNRYGDRVLNEKQPYNERGQAHFHWDPSQQEYPNKLLFQIYDRHVAEDPRPWPYRGPVPMPGTDSPFVITGSTIEALAEAIQSRLTAIRDLIGDVSLAPEFASRLSESIARYDSFARDGRDLDFHRGESPIQVLVSGPGREGALNPTMAPFAERGPYYCIIAGAGALDTKGGPRVTVRGQIIGAAGEPIPGLFGAGNCIASPFGQGYPGAGGSLGAAMTVSYLAANAVADDLDAVIGC